MNFLDIFSKNTEISNFMKICPVGAEFFPYGQTDMTEVILAFLDFANAFKNCERAGQICYAVRSCLYSFRYFRQALQINIDI